MNFGAYGVNVSSSLDVLDTASIFAGAVAGLSSPNRRVPGVFGAFYVLFLPRYKAPKISLWGATSLLW